MRNDYLKIEAIRTIELHTAFTITAVVCEQEIVLEDWLWKFIDFTLIKILNEKLEFLMLLNENYII